MSILLRYSKNQKHRRPILDCQGEAEKLNRSCGDSCKIRVSLKPFNVGYDADGCSVHMASIEIASEMCLEMAKDQAKDWVWGVLQDLEQSKDTHDDPRLLALFEIRSFPVRRKCVLLAWQTLYEALDSAGA